MNLMRPSRCQLRPTIMSSGIAPASSHFSSDWPRRYPSRYTLGLQIFRTKNIRKKDTRRRAIAASRRKRLSVSLPLRVDVRFLDSLRANEFAPSWQARTVLSHRPRFPRLVRALQCADIRKDRWSLAHRSLGENSPRTIRIGYRPFDCIFYTWVRQPLF